MKASIISIGQEAYKLVLQTGKYEDSLYDVAKKYGIKYASIRSYVSKYRMMIVDPKPSLEEEDEFKKIKAKGKIDSSSIKRPDYVYLDEIINALLNVNNDNDLILVMNKYDLTIVKRTILEYIASLSPGKDQAKKLKLLSILEELEEHLQKKNGNLTNVEEARKKIITIINLYLASKEIVPDTIALSYYGMNTDMRAFYTTLESFAKKDEESRKLYEKFINEKERRISEFVKSIQVLLKTNNISSITTFDLELVTGVSLKTFVNTILKIDVASALGKNTADLLYKKAKYGLSGYKIYSLEEAKKIRLVYQGQEMSEKDVEEIYDFLANHNIDQTYNNIILAYRKKVLSREESIGKEVYEQIILGLGIQIKDILGKYGIDSKKALEYVQLYRKRFFEPKPTELEETKYKLLISGLNNNFTYFDELEGLLLNASSDNDFINILKRYDWVTIRSAIKEFLAGTSDLVVQEKLKFALTKFKELRIDKTSDQKSLTSVSDIIDEYVESGDIYPDFILIRNGKNIKHFNSKINHPESLSEEEQQDIKYFLIVKEERLKSFILKVQSMYEKMKDKSLNSLDAQLMTGMNMRMLLHCLNKLEVINAIGRKCASELVSYLKLNSGNARKYSTEEALELKYSYNGREMTIQDILNILRFLEENNLEKTFNNITLAFNKIVKGEISFPKKVNIN